MRNVLFVLLVLVPPLSLGQPDPETTEVRAWREFTQQLEAAGVDILNTYPQPTALDKAEGLRYLLQQLGSSLQQALINQPDQISLLRIGATTINKWGMDGADAKYQGARISADGNYLLHGKVGTSRLFALQTARMDGVYAAYGSLTGDELQIDGDGHFEVLISAQKPVDWRGAWLELNPEADSLLIREYFSDWETERPGTYQLDRLDFPQAEQPVTTEQMVALLKDSASTFATRTPQWQGNVDKARQHLLNKVYMQKADGQGLSSNAYGSGWFEIGEGDALLIELDAPDALLWSVQLGNVWWESLDYVNHLASYNDSQAIPSTDGKYRFVLSNEDPGVPNWLDPAGHSHGAILFRMQNARQITQPVMKLVAYDELAEQLPKDTPKVSGEQRQRDIALRRRHAAVRWAP